MASGTLPPVNLPLRTRRRVRPLVQAVQERHPPFRLAVAADARIASRQRGEPAAQTSRRAVAKQVLHLIWATDAFGALVLYRLRASCQRRGIPVVPRLAHRLAMSWAQVCIGDPVLVHPGVLLPHGQVIIDGFTEISSGVRIRPFVTIGLVDGDVKGPTILRHVKVGTGAKVLGPIVVGEGANIGANAVVIRDVEPGAVMAGVPARRISSRT